MKKDFGIGLPGKSGGSFFDWLAGRDSWLAGYVRNHAGWFDGSGAIDCDILKIEV